MKVKNEIILTTINAKWIHPSLALRLLKANLGDLEDKCEIIEFALRQPLAEKLEPLLSAQPRILGISVSIWNHLATLELLEELFKQDNFLKPIIVLGGPEVSHLPQDAEIFRYADYIIKDEGEISFRLLCENIFQNGTLCAYPKFISGGLVNLNEIKSAYHLYTDEDAAKKLIYIESSRGCLFNCEFCLSAAADNKPREFPLEQFLAQMNILINRGVKTFKFLDRSINTNIPRLLRIIEFFLNKIEQSRSLIPHSTFLIPNSNIPHSFTIHFEMVPSIFPPELIDALAKFPPGTLRLEIGIQTLNAEAAAIISRHSNPEKELKTLRLLREKTNAIIHADLIAGLPREDIESFGRGFDQLWDALAPDDNEDGARLRAEIQLGILKLLPGAPVSRHNESFGMRFSALPPYEIEETSSFSTDDIRRIKNFARFWEIIINRGLYVLKEKTIFDKFMIISDKLYAHFKRNWGIDKFELFDYFSTNF